MSEYSVLSRSAITSAFCAYTCTPHTLAQAALAVGCTLAPTSMGIALNVLKQAKMLNTPTGQLIIAAAVLDDVIALLLLSELQAPRTVRAHTTPSVHVHVPRTLHRACTRRVCA